MGGSRPVIPLHHARLTRKQRYERAIRLFDPQWFAMIMGTGVVVSLLRSLPIGGQSLPVFLATVLHILNTLLFSAFLSCLVTRCAIDPEFMNLETQDPTQTSCLGLVPISMSILIVGTAGTICQDLDMRSDALVTALWGLWLLNTLVTVLFCFGQLNALFSRRDLTTHMMSTTWLIPVVAPIVAAAAGSIIATEMLSISPQRALSTVAVSFGLASVGGIMTFMMITLYLYQLLFHGLPEGNKICSFFLPMGPVSQMGCCILLMNQVVQSAFSLHEYAIIPHPDAMYVLCILGVFMAFSLWSMASTWMVIATFAFINTLRKTRYSFAMSFWCLIYPIGVYATLTLHLGKVLQSDFFRICGVGFACLAVAIWVFALSSTFKFLLVQASSGSTGDLMATLSEQRHPSETSSLHYKDQSPAYGTF